MLCDGQVSELRANEPVGAGDLGWKDALIIAAEDRDHDFIAHRHGDALGQRQPHAVLGEVTRLAHDRSSVAQCQRGGQFGGDARGRPDLTRLVRHVSARTADDDVVDDPREVDQHGAGRPFPKDELDQASEKANRIGRQQRQIRFGHLPVVEPFPEQATLDRHVELAALGADQRPHHRPQDVPRQHRLVDFVPERMPKAALDARVGQVCQHNVGQCVDEDHGRRCVEHVRTEQQVGQWRCQEDQARQAVEEVQHRVHVAKPLAYTQALAQQRVINPEDLAHPARPADALADMTRQTFGREPGRLRDRKVGGVVSKAAEFERGVRIFGHRLDGDATNLK